MTRRVQIPAYTDHWMKGDRFGELIDVRWGKVFKNRWGDKANVAHVKLDTSKKIVRVLLDDCTEAD